MTKQDKRRIRDHLQQARTALTALEDACARQDWQAVTDLAVATAVEALAVSLVVGLHATHAARPAEAS